MKWLIVEDALRDRKGHWLEYVSTFVRGLKELGDEVTVLCDRKAEGFVIEQTGAWPVLPESIWHRMGDGAGPLKRYARVPRHVIATFFALRRVLKKINHREHREHGGGGEEVSQGPAASPTESAGLRPGYRAGVEFSNPSTSELARDSKNTASIRSADGPACLPVTSYPLLATCSPPDWIFVPTVLVHHLLGWWMLLKTGLVPKRSRVLLFFPNLPIRLDNAGKPAWSGGPTTKMLAWLFAEIRKEVESGRVVLGVETHAMRRALESLIRTRVVYLPHPVEFHAETRRRGGVESSECLTTEDTESTEDQFVQKQGGAWASQAGASEPDSLASKLAVSPVSESLTRSASALASLPATSYTPPATSAKPIFFGCYGAARWEKGSDVFQEAIKLILKKEVVSEKWQVASGKNQTQPATRCQLAVTAASRSLCFAIQWVQDFEDEKGNLVQLDPWLKNHPQVEVIGRYFAEGEYEQRLARTDVMVLPYRSPYRLRVSRVVIEAMIHGLPVIATKATTLFEQAGEHGVVVGCEEGSAESLAQAILEVLEGFETMQAEAMQKAEKASESFSVGYFRESLSEAQS